MKLGMVLKQNGVQDAKTIYRLSSFIRQAQGTHGMGYLPTVLIAQRGGGTMIYGENLLSSTGISAEGWKDPRTSERELN